MTRSLRSALEQEVARFKTWARDYGPNPSGEWECDYPDWTALYNSVSQFITASKVEDWDKSVVALLLYTIARDNECENLAEHLQADMDKLQVLAKAAVQSCERDAKWQLAEQLALCNDRLDAAESLLLDLQADDDEYVKLRALMALGKIKSSQVENLVGTAWETGDEYQRMSVLHALWNVQSKQLSSYLDLAHADGRPYLTAFANRILRGEGVD